jgi:hypothetical protein
MGLGLKRLPRTNSLVDLAYSSNIEEKSFALLTTDGNVMKHFLSLMKMPNKLECFFPEILFFCGYQ